MCSCNMFFTKSSLATHSSLRSLFQASVDLNSNDNNRLRGDVLSYLSQCATVKLVNKNRNRRKYKGTALQSSKNCAISSTFYSSESLLLTPKVYKHKRKQRSSSFFFASITESIASSLNTNECAEDNNESHETLQKTLTSPKDGKNFKTYVCKDVEKVENVEFVEKNTEKNVETNLEKSAGTNVEKGSDTAHIYSERGTQFIIGESFYRPESSFGRDLAVLAARIYKDENKSLRVMDVMCGSGVRTVRYLNHSEADFVWANDASPATHLTLLHNVTRVTSDPLESDARVNEPDRNSRGVSGRGEEEIAGEEEREGEEGPLVGLRLGTELEFEAEEGTQRRVDRKDFEPTWWKLERKDERERQMVESKRWRITHEDANRILFHCYQVKDFYDLIDVDSFGSDSVFLGSALMAVRHGGLLYATSTDGFSSGGHAPFRSLGAYGAYIRPLPYANELGLRMLIGGVVREAALRGLEVEPVFSHYSYHGPVFRTLLRVSSHKKWTASNYKFIAHCFLCGQVETLEWSQLGNAICTAPSHGIEPRPMAVVGPLWTGPLHSDRDVTAITELAKKWNWTGSTEAHGTGAEPSARNKINKKCGKVPKSDSRNLGEILEIMAEESDPELLPGYIHLDQLSRIGRVPTPRRNDLISALRELGYKASRSHVEANAVKTNGSMLTCIEIARSLASTKSKLKELKKSS